MKRSLLLGCGNSRIKKIWVDGKEEWAGELTTLDMNPDCGADVVWDLEKRPLPFPDDTFDELGAFDVLEHQGKQGDFRGWFDEMAEYWRILKPGGLFFIIVPVGEDRFVDPGHTRFIGSNNFGFLNQRNYELNIEQGKAMTDYRWYWKKNFEVGYLEQENGHHMHVVLLKA